MAATFRATDWYDAPLDYDLVFDEDTVLEADFLERVARLHGRGLARVLEPACGTGRLVAELARRGSRVAGFDASPTMLAHAADRLRAEGLEAHLFEDRLESFRVRGRFDLAHCLVSTFKYVLDEEGARSHLARVARALAPGGLYVLGLHLSDYETDRRSRERWVVERDGRRVVCNIQCWPPDRRRRREKVRSRLTVEEDGETRRTETVWDFRTYDAAELRALLSSVPELEHVTTFDFTYAPENERELDDEQLDCVLVLRRRG